MKPRAIWTGHLKISLLTIPIRVYTALNPAEKIAFNQLHKDCCQRLHQQLVCPLHGKVDRDQVVKGYEIQKDQFVVIGGADLEGVKLETTHVIELVQFIAPKEIDPLYLDTPYFLGPDGPVSLEAFLVLREGLRRVNQLGLGRVVLSGREKLVAIRPVGLGLLMTTLRYPNEVRQAHTYFEELARVKVEEGKLALARQLIENKRAPYEPAKFSDRYQSGLLELIKSKLKGVAPVQVPAEGSSEMVDFVEALKLSIAQTRRERVAVLEEKPVKQRKRQASLAA